jgi:hypothetical protein
MQQKSLKCLPLEELISAFAAWLTQAHKHNASTDSNHHKEKGLHISACLEISNVSAWDGWLSRFKRHNTAYRTLSSESRSVDSEIV